MSLHNRVFNKFIHFVDNMHLFYSLASRGYEGFMNGTESISEWIINSGKLSDFQRILNSIGIDYKLKQQDIDGRKHHERDLVCSVHQGYMKA